MDLIVLADKMMRGRPPKIDMDGISELCFVAGGSVRRWFVGEKQTSDIDIFPLIKENEKEIVSTLELKELIWKNKNTDTYRKDGVVYQIIHRYAKSEDILLDTFDFCHCQFAWDGKKVSATPNAIITALRKHLMVHKFQEGYEMDSLRRAFKYQRQGYTPCWGTLQDIAKQIGLLEDKDIEKQVELSPGGGIRTVRFD